MEPWKTDWTKPWNSDWFNRPEKEEPVLGFNPAPQLPETPPEGEAPTVGSASPAPSLQAPDPAPVQTRAQGFSTVDETDDLRASRHFANSAYLDDGSMRHLQTQAGSPVSPEDDVIRDREGREIASIDPNTGEIVYANPAEAPAPEVDPFEGEGFGALSKRRGQQFAAGATEAIASMPEAIALFSRDIVRQRHASAAEAVDALAKERLTLKSIVESNDLDSPKSRAALMRIQNIEGEIMRAVRMVQEDTGIMETPVGETELFQRGERIRQSSAETFGTPDPRDQGFWSMVAQGGGNVAVMGAASAIPGVGLPAGAAIGAGMNSSQLYKEAIDAGVEEEVAMDAARIGAAIGASEIVPITRALKILPKKVRQKVSGAFMKRFTNIAQSAGEEAAQEYLAQVANNVTAQNLYDPERGWTEGATEAALVGAVIGGALGGAGAVRTPREREDEPLNLKPGDLESPIQNDVLSDGNKILDQIAATGTLPPSTAAPSAPQVGVSPEPEAGAFVQTPAEDTAGRIRDQIAQLPPATLDAPAAPGVAPDVDGQPDTPAPTPEPEAPTTPAPETPGPRKMPETGPYEIATEDGGAVEVLPEITSEGGETGRFVRVERAPDGSVRGTTIVDAPEAAAAPQSAPAAPVEAQPAPVVPDEAPEAPSASTPAPAPTAQEVDVAAAEADTAPTDAQKEAGNYRKGSVKLQGLDISIENARGSERSGTDADGEAWSVTMPAHYGYVKGTKGADGDHVDVYIGENPESDFVAVVDQVDLNTGQFDEHKVILGAADQAQAEALYEGGFSDGRGRDRMGGVTTMTMAEFKDWVKDGDTTKPASPNLIIRSAPKGTQAQAQPGAFVAIRRGSGEVIGEFQDGSRAELFNAENVATVPVAEYLPALNAEIKARGPEASSDPETFKKIAGQFPASAVAAPEAAPVVADSDQQIEAARQRLEAVGITPPERNPLKKPFTDRIKSMGGIDPSGAIGQELKSLGITSQTAPGLFRRGGAKDLDNVPHADWIAEYPGMPDDGSGNYVDRQWIIDRLADEAAGFPINTVAQQEIQDQADVWDAALEQAMASPADSPDGDADDAMLDRFDALTQTDLEFEPDAGYDIPFTEEEFAAYEQQSRETEPRAEDLDAGAERIGTPEGDQDAEVERAPGDQGDAGDAGPAVTEETDAGTQQVIPGAEADEGRSAAARRADQRREVQARAQQSRMGAAAPQEGAGPLFGDEGGQQGDIFDRTKDVKEQRLAFFFSPLARAVENAKQKSATGKDWKAIIRKMPGVKGAEIDWMGVDDWLDMQEGQVPKQALLDFLSDSHIELAEDQLGAGREIRIETDYTNEISDGVYAADIVFTDDMSYGPTGEYVEAVGEYLFEELGPETMSLGEIQDIYDSQTQFEEYTEEGGENYREILLRMPNLHKEGRNAPRKQERELARAEEALKDHKATRRQYISDGWDTYPGGYDAWVDRGRQLGVEIEKARTSADKAVKFPFVQSSHFEQENIVVHARVKDRTGADGEKVLFVEEIQSDLASKHREATESPDVTARRNELRGEIADQVRIQDNQAKAMAEIVGGDTDSLQVMNVLARTQTAYRQGMDPSENMRGELDDVFQTIMAENQPMFEAMLDRDSRISRMRSELLSLGTEKALDPSIPDTPFKEENTYILMVKRLLREAAEGGYKKLSWTPGYMQAERWDAAARNVVEGVSWGVRPNGEQTFKLRMSGGMDSITGRFDGAGLIYEASRGEMNDKPLSSLIGPSLAKRMVEEESGSVSGQKITFPDSGYAIAYDQQIKRAVDKFAKKHGSRVVVDKTMPDMKELPELLGRNEDGTGIYSDGATRPVWSIEITDKLREAAMEPLPIMQKGGQRKVDLPKIAAMMPELRKKLDKMQLKKVKLVAAEGPGVQGAFGTDTAGNMTIVIGASIDPENTLRHEAIHALKAMDLFTAKEWSALEAEAENIWMKRYDIAGRYSELSKDQQIEEAIAEAFGDYKGRAPNNLIQAAFAKLKRFFKALGEVLTGNGITSVEDVFTDVAEGRVGARGGVTPEVPSRAAQADPTLASEMQGENLMVVHNISAEGLKKADELGGLAAPSLAVVRADVGFDNFGEITLIGKPNMANPKERGVRAFNADVYSPRQPRAQYDINGRAFRRMMDDFDDAAVALQASPQGNITPSKISRDGLEALKHEDVVKMTFLMEIGDAPRVTYRKKEAVPAALRKWKGKSQWEIAGDPEFVEALKKDIKRQIDQDFDGADNADVVKPKALARLLPDGEPSQMMVQDRARKLSKADQPRRVDSYETGNAIRKRMGKTKKRQKQFNDWIEARFGDVLANPFFETEQGRRKPYDLDKLVREMTRTLRDGEGFNYGVGSVRSTVAHQFKTISEIKDYRGQITDEATMSKLKDEANDELFALADKFSGYHGSGKDFGWGDIFSEFLKDLGRGRLREWQTSIFNEPVPDALITEARQFLDKLRDMPTEYFEVKMQRAVDLSEFEAAVVPQGTDRETIDILRDAGLKISRYEKGSSDARLGALNDAGWDFRFQKHPPASYLPQRHVHQSLQAANAGRFARLKAGGADLWERGRINLQDRYLPMLRAVQAAEEQMGQKLPDWMNPYMTEEQMAGQVGRDIDDVEQLYVQPIIDTLAETKGELTAENVGHWLNARHAKERNARIASINPAYKPGEGSGLTDAEAQTILDEFANGPHQDKLDRIATLVDDLRDFTLDVKVKSGLLTQADADAMRQMYSFYVPLRGFAETDHADAVMDVQGIGRRLNVKGKEQRRAMGRQSMAFNPLVGAITQAQEAAIRAGKNRVGNAFYHLVEANPSDKWEITPVKQQRYFNSSTGMIETRATPAANTPLEADEFATKVNGQEFRIKVNDPRLAQALGNVGSQQFGMVVTGLMKFSRYFSSVNTMLNPEFLITNALRDFTTAEINIQGFGKEDRNKLGKSMAKNWRKAFMGAWRGMADTNSKDEWAKHFRAYEKAGGKVSFWQIEDPNQTSSDLEKRIKRASSLSGKARSNLLLNTRDNPILRQIERANLAIDNAIRLAAFVEARKLGWSEQKAASLAKNLTVNFNRRGEMSPVLNGLYPFFNAAVQGTHILATALKYKRPRRIVATLVAMGVLEDMLNSWLSEEDEDGELAWDKVQDWKLRRNIMINADGDNPWSIPLPYGYNVFPYAGKQVSKVIRGVKEPGDAIADTLATMIESVSPISGSSIGEALIPTIAKPAAEVAMNKDMFLGRDIAPKKWSNDEGLPDAYNAYRSTHWFWKELADIMNRGTGGDTLNPGLVDVSPDVLEHLFGFATGGMGRFAERITNLGTKMVTGDVAGIELNDIPFARQLAYTTGEWLDRDRYYRFSGQVQEALNREKVAAQTGDKLSDRDAVLVKMKQLRKITNKRLRELRNLKYGVYDSENLTAAARNVRLDKIRDDEAKLFLAFNKQFLDLMGPQGE